MKNGGIGLEAGKARSREGEKAYAAEVVVLFDVACLYPR